MNRYLKNIQLFFVSLVLAITGMAQEKQVDVNISTDEGGSNFWGQPWVWVVGAALFILLLVAILKSGSRSAE